jgi:heme exporter protein B
MNGSLKTILILIRKDLRVQARARHALALVLVLGLLIIVVLGLGLSQGAKITGLAPLASLWIAYLFGGVIAFEKSMVIEHSDDALAGLLLAPIDRGTIYVSKLITNLVLMALLAVVITPCAVVLFRYDLGEHLGAFALIMGLGMFGFAALGTLFSAATSSTRLQGGLLPLLVFPLSLPLIILTTLTMRKLFEEGEADLSTLSVGYLIAFDVIFVVMGWLIFEFLLEP